MVLKSHAASMERSVYEPDQQGLIFPKEPVFETVEEERHYRKERLAAACRIFARHGFGQGSGGHLTVRDPEHQDCFWTNPMGVSFSKVKVSNLVLADHDGTVIEGRHAINRAGYVLHSAIHARNPEIVGSCHAHTLNGTAWAAMGRKLDMITQDVCRFYNDHEVLGEGAGRVPTGNDSGTSVAEAFANNSAIIHQNHGILTVSRHSIDIAAWLFIMLDRCCGVQLMVEACQSKPVPVSEKNAKTTYDIVTNPVISWLNFNTYYDELVQEEPDFLE